MCCSQSEVATQATLQTGNRGCFELCPLRAENGRNHRSCRHWSRSTRGPAQ